MCSDSVYLFDLKFRAACSSWHQVVKGAITGTVSQHSNYTFPSRGLQMNKEPSRPSTHRHIEVGEDFHCNQRNLVLLGGIQWISGDSG